MNWDYLGEQVFGAVGLFLLCTLVMAGLIFVLWAVAWFCSLLPWPTA